MPVLPSGAEAEACTIPEALKSRPEAPQTLPAGVWMIFLGCDPGLHGALAVLDQQGQPLHLVDTPLMQVGGKHEVDRQEVKRVLRALVGPFVRRSAEEPLVGGGTRMERASVPIACVELVHSMPKQGVVSAFRFGQGFELWMMAFTMLDVAVETVSPQRWKGVMLDGLPKGKDAARHRAKALWPEWADRFSRVKDDGRAEACLIAEWMRRQWVKTP